MAKMARQKFERISRVANANGIIAAAAMDQRGSLKKAIAKEKGVEPAAITDSMMEEFKAAVSEILTPHASAILLDPQWGVPAMRVRAKAAGLLVSYEESGYDQTGPGRMPSLLPAYDVPRLIQLGADAVKVLMYYTPFDPPEVNRKKHDWVRAIGNDCQAHHVPFFLECVCYDEQEKGEKSLEFALKKPKAVQGYMHEFSKPEYQVDVLKAEIPVDMAYVQGAAANQTGETAYTRKQAMDIFREVAASTKLPFIYLSAGVNDDVFRESLDLAGEAGIAFNGVLCGRATWKEGIPVYARRGQQALKEWLADRGVRNIQALNEVLSRVAAPWWQAYGGRERITLN